jgi:hypothetical protein
VIPLLTLPTIKWHTLFTSVLRTGCLKLVTTIFNGNPRSNSFRTISVPVLDSLDTIEGQVTFKSNRTRLTRSAAFEIDAIGKSVTTRQYTFSALWFHDSFVRDETSLPVPPDSSRPPRPAANTLPLPLSLLPDPPPPAL